MKELKQYHFDSVVKNDIRELNEVRRGMEWN